jgi:ABC-type transporter Mla maintaining outer membrane lipid asymmetry permease subunit MlaE
MLTPWNYTTILANSSLYGGIFAVTSFYYGLSFTGGVPDVCLSVTRAIIASSLANFGSAYSPPFDVG